MSVISTIETDIGKVLHFLVGASSAIAKVGPAVQAGALVTLQAVVTAVQDAGSAVASEGLNLTLDSQTVADIKNLIATCEADLKALGIKL